MKNTTETLIEHNMIVTYRDSYRINRNKLNENYIKENNLYDFLELLDDEILFKVLHNENSFILKQWDSYQFNNKCKCCGNETEFVQWNKGYKKYCSTSCSTKIRVETRNNMSQERKDEIKKKRKETCLEKYGVENPMMSKDINQKSVKTQIEKYGGVFNAVKSKQTKLERYGNENYNNPEQNKITNLERYGVVSPLSKPEINTAGRNSIFEKYGTYCVQSDETVRNKTKETFLKLYGCEFYNNPKKISESHQNKTLEEIANAVLKKKDTCLEKYGNENYINNTKREKTCLEKYGVTNYSQTGLNETSGYKWKEYKLPSGKITKIQGYENKLLDELLLEYDESEIISSRKDMPEIWYFDKNGTKRRYFPDVYIQKTNTIYEVKSEYTIKVNKEINELKFQAVKNAGYNFILKIY